ncbi:MAG TPA: Rho termination factor N-terminal domain-containing protein [Gaiellaceae bacterium]
MFRRNKTAKLREKALNASELALQLAQDQKFRKRLLSAIAHSSEARRRARGRGRLTNTARRFAADQALQAELRRARNDLQQAYARLDAKRGRDRLRRITLLAGLASLAAIPQLRARVSGLIANAPKDGQQLHELARRIRSRPPGNGQARPRQLEDLTKEELYARAQEADIPGRSEMSKEELVAALRAKS